MKSITIFFTIAFLFLFTFTSTQVSAVSTKSYLPNKSYNYTYSSYSKNGKLLGTGTFNYIKSGSKKGFWRLDNEDYYVDYAYDTYDKSLWKIYGTAKGIVGISYMYTDFLIPGNLKKGTKGRVDLGLGGIVKYKVLSTKANVKVSGKLYKNTIKMWYSGNRIVYYAKNIGEIKQQILYEGEYKTYYALTKVKKN